MKIILTNINNLAIVLHTLRISPLYFTAVIAIIFSVFIFFAVYIQSIGSGIEPRRSVVKFSFKEKLTTFFLPRRVGNVSNPEGNEKKNPEGSLGIKFLTPSQRTPPFTDRATQMGG